jgi:hypothetical protein
MVIFLGNRGGGHDYRGGVYGHCGITPSGAQHAVYRPEAGAAPQQFILGKRFPEYQRSERRVSIVAPFVRMIHDWLDQDNYRASWIFDRLNK